MCNYILTTDLTANLCKLVAIIFILNSTELNENFFSTYATVKVTQNYCYVFFFLLSKQYLFILCCPLERLEHQRICVKSYNKPVTQWRKSFHSAEST